MISAIILTKNEDKNIKDCLDGLSWCDEVILIDDDSDDDTVEIAKRNGAKVFIRKLDNFSAQRNFGLTKAKGEWVLFVDADEKISAALWYEIMQSINEPINPFSGFNLYRRDIMWGKELRYGDNGDSKFLRLARRDSGKWEGLVHEKWVISGSVGDLKNRIYHYPHQSVAEFLSEVNYYTDLRAQELFEKKVKTNWFLIILYTKAKFIKNYFYQLGFLDGIPGLVCAMIMSMHSFLTRSKLWLMWQKDKK